MHRLAVFASGRGTDFAAIVTACERGELPAEVVLMVCDKTNAASARTIQKNGGVLENEVAVDGVTEQRYWITL